MKVWLVELQAEWPEMSKINKAWRTVKKRMSMEYSFKKAYQFLQLAFEFLSTTSFINVKINNVFYLRISHKNLF